MDDIVKPKQDVVFKKMFADENNKELLIDLIASLMDLKKDYVKDVTVLNPEITPESVSEKFSRLDILMSTKDRTVDLEMQTTDSSDFVDKELVYWAKMCAQDVPKGKPYGELRQNISISILDFDHNKFHHSDYDSLFTLYDTKHKLQLTNKCAFFFFELNKLRNLKKDISEFSQKELWLKLINSESREDLNMLKELNNPIMNEAVNVVSNMSSDPTVRELIRQREFAEHEEASRIKEAMEKRDSELVANMKAMGLSDEQIKLALNGPGAVAKNAQAQKKTPPKHGGR